MVDRVADALVCALDAAPTVSVVVPAHNAADTLSACLAALAASQACAHEVVVVDDGSTDNTAAVATVHGARLVRLPHQQGAAAARNAGARVARAPILLFVDADVLVAPTTLAHVARVLADDPSLSAVFGSYTATPAARNFCSVYKNLVHHLTHQAARPEASTFWSGAGAVRAGAFWAAGGFDPRDTRTADVEDIALGYRLTGQGHRIRLDRTLQVVHAKRYSFLGLLRSDVLHRAIPWTRLMLRERRYQNDLNTGQGSLASALALLALAPAAVAGTRQPWAWGMAAALGALFALLNRRLLAHCAARGPLFLLQAVGMTALYYLYSIVGAAVGLLLHLAAPQRSAASAAAPASPPPAAGLVNRREVVGER